MRVAAKICGLNEPAAVAAAVAGGARYLGLVFYPPSPRSLSPDAAAELVARVPADVAKVAVVVDADDELLEAIARAVAPQIFQLHGTEPPRRVAEIGRRFGARTMKAIAVSDAEDLAVAEPYEQVADLLMFDAKAPRGAGALPGGNGQAFDWRLLAGRTWRRPWVLSGGLDVENLRDAVTVSGARTVDVSTGVEDAPGRKNPDKIRAFLAAVQAL
jgi:phosphoribosylanthranilate isomerase